ncbi:MerR family transcriptional regulator [Arthrobacter sp. TMS2-4]
MTEQPLLSIGDFTQMSSLSAQTLRYYHHQGLLVPAEVDEDTGYRGYTFDQTHHALLIVTLRRAAVSIRDIRNILNDPDLLPAALREHQAMLERQRSHEDRAMVEAWRLAKGWPIADIRDRAPSTAITRQIPAETVEPDDIVVPQRIRAEAEALHRELVGAGLETTGLPWCRYALHTSEDKAKMMMPQGPDWIVAVDLPRAEDAPNPLPSNHALHNCSNRRELIVQLPATPTMVTYAAAIEYLTRACRDQDLVPDFNQLRYGLAPTHVELALTITPLDQIDPVVPSERYRHQSNHPGPSDTSESP